MRNDPILERMNAPPTKCMNCQCSMRMDESILREAKIKDSDSASQFGLDGRAQNLMQVICDAETPNDAPICKECSDALLRGMDAQLHSLEDECIAYRKLIENLKTEHSNSDVASEKQQLQNLMQEEEELRRLEAQLGEEERKEELSLQQAKNELSQSTEKEQQLWRDFRDAHQQLLDLDEECRRLEAEIRYSDCQLKQLVNTNVLALCFHIWVDGPIGQINGFHMGRLSKKQSETMRASSSSLNSVNGSQLPDRPVDWSEINAAWGQAALLLDVLLQRMNVQPSMYKIVTMGSHSYIKVNKPSGESKELPLYAAGGWKPFGTVNHSTDEGAVAFLECLATLQAALKACESSWTLPHVITHDLLADRSNMKFSVKMQFNSEERWTRAMKCLLNNLKWALTMVDVIRQRTQ